MLWIDYESYCGPDRRHHAVMRWRDRRRINLASAPPPFDTALRQLRMRIIDARGVRADALASRAQAVAILARMQGETEAAAALLSFAALAARGRDTDVRTALHASLDRVHAALRTLH
ncbi:MAG: hypothetical protein K2P58_07970 [Hyphomonadaceae bacterium]|nr:hypothetical protein [Hyphomonadaceae bacterium]